MNRREVLTCLTTSLLVIIYVVELIIRPNLEIFFPPLLSGSSYPAQFTIYLVFGPLITFTLFSRSFLAATIVTSKLTVVSQKVSGNVSISPFTPQFICPFRFRFPAALVPQGPLSFPNFQPLTNLIFYFNRCVKTGWKSNQSSTLF